MVPLRRWSFWWSLYWSKRKFCKNLKGEHGEGIGAPTPRRCIHCRNSAPGSRTPNHKWLRPPILKVRAGEPLGVSKNSFKASMRLFLTPRPPSFFTSVEWGGFIGCILRHCSRWSAEADVRIQPPPANADIKETGKKIEQPLLLMFYFLWKL